VEVRCGLGSGNH